jgi:hypothetical protein
MLAGFQGGKVDLAGLLDLGGGSGCHVTSPYEAGEFADFSVTPA